MNSNYWNEPLMRSLCVEYRTCTLERRKNEIIRRLQGPLGSMFDAIRQKHFNINPSEVSNLRLESLTKCILAIATYDPQQKSFTFFSYVIKNHLYDYVNNRHANRYRNALELDFDVSQDPQGVDYKQELISILVKYGNTEEYFQYRDIIKTMQDFIRDHDDWYTGDLFMHLLERHERRLVVELVWKVFRLQVHSLKFYHSRSLIDINRWHGGFDWILDDKPVAPRPNDYLIRKQKKSHYDDDYGI